jgi:predicted DNA-binding protein with PD1-like motif
MKITWKKEGISMRYFTSDSVGRTFVISLQKGDLLLETIAELAVKEKIENAAIVSGIATFDEANMQMTTTYDYPIGYKVVNLREPLELASLDGTIIHFEPHIHGVVSNPDQTWAGHILEGCKILYLGEVVIQELVGMNLTRKPNQDGARLIYENR